MIFLRQKNVNNVVYIVLCFYLYIELLKHFHPFIDTDWECFFVKKVDNF